MKTNDSNDQNLSQILRSWKVSEGLPPRFEEQVWARIERAEIPSSNSCLADLKALLQHIFANHAMAYAYVIILLALGLAGGYFKGHQQENQFQSQLAGRYVQSIDPYQKAHLE